MRLRWTRSASHDIDGIGTFIAKDNPAAADRLLDLIRTSAQRLLDYPTIGRAGRVAGTRELVIVGTPYLVVYRIGEDSIDIVAVLHGARKWPKAL